MPATNRLETKIYTAVFKIYSLQRPSATSFIMLPFNTSAFSNTLCAANRATQHKALITPFKEEFDAKPDDVMQHITSFNHQFKGTGVIKDFDFILHENPPRSDIDMTDTKACTNWLSDLHCFTFGNLIIEPSTATIDKLQATQDNIHTSSKKLLLLLIQLQCLLLLRN